VSAVPQSEGSNAREAVAGLLAAAALFFSLLGIAHRPARTIPIAILLALISARMTERHSKLAGWAVAVGAASFVVGMAVAVITKHPPY
jgi:membrane-bound ClpP family serine protease